MSRKEKTLAIIAMLGVGMLIILIPQSNIVTPPKAGQTKFAIAGWSYPDAYGQGIYYFKVLENSSGSWEYTGAVGYYYSDPPAILNWTAGVAIMLRVLCTFNRTLTGVSTVDQGKNYLRHNVSVTNLMSEVVFSKQNFTYYSDESEDGDPIYYYWYYVILNFLPLAGEYYTVTVTYEVYY